MVDAKTFAKTAGIVLLLEVILGFAGIALPGMLMTIVNVVLALWGLWAGFGK